MVNSFRDLWHDYRAEILFGVVLALLVGVSTYLSRFIPDGLFDFHITPALNVCTSAVCLTGVWILFRHSEGMRIRRLWGYALLVWGLGDLFYLICYLVAPMHVMNMGAAKLTTFELLFGNILGWVMTLYPTETLRPGWLTPKVVLWQLLPMVGMVVLDYLIPLDLWPIVSLYPYILLGIVLKHIREYRIWCENNYSSMDNIDVQWIIRYCIMLFILGANYVYMLVGNGHTRAFTQQWFVIFMAVYSTEQILFRKNPWEGLTGKAGLTAERSYSANGLTAEGAQPDSIRLFEEWMTLQKPYLNPDFKLMDIRAVLPMNRTYLSQLISDNYGCTFYQLVTKRRIEEAKRLMKEQPELKIEEVAKCAGFSSSTVFIRSFSHETGLTPKEWRKQT